MWVDWFNHRRLLEPIGYVPPAEFEAAYYVQIARPPPVPPRSRTALLVDLRAPFGSGWPSEGPGDRSGLLAVSEARDEEDRREVGSRSPEVETQAPESP